jgi:hypothetical protein
VLLELLQVEQMALEGDPFLVPAQADLLRAVEAMPW